MKQLTQRKQRTILSCLSDETTPEEKLARIEKYYKNQNDHNKFKISSFIIRLLNF